MTVMQIRTLGDPVLRETASPVETFDDALRRIVDDMLETMYAAPGVGLAANQVGLRTACFVYDDREGHAGFVANPRLSELGGRGDARGGLPVDPRSVPPDRFAPGGFAWSAPISTANHSTSGRRVSWRGSSSTRPIT